MRVCGSCGAWIPDEAAHCPNCGRAAPGTPASPPPPVPATPATPAPPTGDPEGVYRRRAEERLRVLGTLYMVAGFMTLAYVALSFLENATGAMLEAFDQMEKNPGRYTREQIDLAKALFLAPWWLAFSHAVPFLFGALWVYSGSRLRALQGRNSALAGAALLFLPFPCSPCCCLLVPLGVYALITLTRADSESVLATAR